MKTLGHLPLCGARHEGLRTPSKTNDANLDIENALVYTNTYLILKSQQNGIELVTRPALAAALRVRVGLRMEELEFSLPLPLRLTGPPSGLCGWTRQAWPS